MARYSRGKYAWLIDDISGFKIRYKDALTTWDGRRTSKEDFDPKHPSLEPRRVLNEPQALRDPRPDNDGIHAQVNLAAPLRTFNASTGVVGAVAALSGMLFELGSVTVSVT